MWAFIFFAEAIVTQEWYHRGSSFRFFDRASSDHAHNYVRFMRGFQIHCFIRGCRARVVQTRHRDLVGVRKFTHHPLSAFKSSENTLPTIRDAGIVQHKVLSTVRWS